MAEELLRSMQVVANELESLRGEHTALLNELQSNDGSNEANEANEANERATILSKSLQTAELAIAEAQIMKLLQANCESSLAEMAQLNWQVDRMRNDNTDLRLDLAEARKKLEEAVHRIEDLEQHRARAEMIDDVAQSEFSGLDCQIEEGDEGDESGGEETAFDFQGHVQRARWTPLPLQAPAGVSVTVDDAFAGVPSRVRRLRDMIRNYFDDKQYDVAITLCKETIEELERTFRPDHPAVAELLTLQAMIYREQGKLQHAAELLLHAIVVREQAHGTCHPQVAAAMNNLAVLYVNMNKYEEAECMCQRALEVREKLYGEEHPEVAKQLNNLGIVYKVQKKYAEAERCFIHALNIYLSTFGPEDPSVAKTKTYITQLYAAVKSLK